MSGRSTDSTPMHSAWSLRTRTSDYPFATKNWVIKIDYDHGVRRRTDVGGWERWGFSINSTNPKRGFPIRTTCTMSMKRRCCSSNQLCNSRLFSAFKNNCHMRAGRYGQSTRNMTASPVLNVRLGNFSDAKGVRRRWAGMETLSSHRIAGPPAAIFGSPSKVLPDGHPKSVCATRLGSRVTILSYEGF